MKTVDCLSCDNSHSLPAGEPFDDDRIFEVDMLVCMVGKTPKLVPEWHHCNEHTELMNY